MKYYYLAAWFFLLISPALRGQEEMSRADALYFEFAYRDAITEYYKEMNEGPLTNKQQLNLADAFLKVGNYKQASEKYLEVYRADSTMSDHQFNKMLQALMKTSGLERAKAFLATRSASISPQLLENADFNFELLGSEKMPDLDFKIFNINSNSAQSDFAPAFYGDKLLFSSGRPQDKRKTYEPTGEGYLDIFIGKVGLGGQITNPNPFTGIPESPFHEATPYYSMELNEIFYILSNSDKGKLTFDEKGKNTLALGIAEANGNFRYLLRDLSTSFYYPFYDSKSSRLYFAANFEDSLGGTDIYYVNTNDGLIMSAPVNLGPRINTPGNEIAPFIFEDSFYFSSDVFYGIGGMDIYKSQMGEDNFFSIPVNLGKVINSPEDDFGFIIKNNIREGLIGYFSSNRSGGKGGDDIYGFIVKEKPGLKTIVLRGQVTRQNTTEAIPRAGIKLLDRNDRVVKEVYTNDTGNYWAEVPWRDYIRLQVSKDRYSLYDRAMDTTALEEVRKNKTLNISLANIDDLVQEKEDQTVIKMNKFFFDPGQAEITPEIASELDKAVEALKEFPKLQLRIESHTDSRGGSAANFKLSQKRAEAMKQYLLEKGVPSTNILYTVGYGEDKIINNCKDGVYCLEILHKQNERQWIVVLNYNLLFP